MQNYLEQSYCAYEGAYQVPVYGLFSSDSLPHRKLNLPEFAISKSSNPFHLEYPKPDPRYEAFVFDVELSEFPNYWRDLSDAVFEEMKGFGAQFSWLSLDPGFEFELMFGKHFSQHVYAFCQSGEDPIYVDSEGSLSSQSWAQLIGRLKDKWQLELPST
jgi:hypothetical protein